MSGIVGILHGDGAPVEQALLERLTAFMAFRGPDAQAIWLDGSVGFGHTMLRTTFEAAKEQQPYSLDGRVWITGDVRVDARAELIGKLRAKGRHLRDGVPDIELILHAYELWADNCVQHLLGAFSFAIWDGRTQRLFAARDHFGIEPFYYAQKGATLLFSNTLNCLRQHPLVSDTLNEQAIGDFLLVYTTYNFEKTTFADIQTLPPAHTMTWQAGRLRLQRYWTLPKDDIIRYRQPSDYVEHLWEVFQQAVGDRLRFDRVAVSMSGGLDSTAVTATAKALNKTGEQDCQLAAFTGTLEEIVCDKEETHFATLTAQHLEIPISYYSFDQFLPYQNWGLSEALIPEPCLIRPYTKGYNSQIHQALSHSPVLLTGFGGDALQRAEPAHFLNLLLMGRWGLLTGDLKQYLSYRRHRPPLGLSWRWQNRQKVIQKNLPYPEYINPAFAARIDLQARWQILRNNPMAGYHQTHDRASTELRDPYWSNVVFPMCAAESIHAPVKPRHPFFDLRLITYLLAIPPLPWGERKHLLRLAMRGHLPEGVRLRPKSVPNGNPLQATARRFGVEWASTLADTAELSTYVEQDKLKRLVSALKEGPILKLRMALRALNLASWLRSQRQFHSYCQTILSRPHHVMVQSWPFEAAYSSN